MWDLRQNKLTYTMRGHADSVTGLSLSSEGSYLLSNAMDNTGVSSPRAECGGQALLCFAWHRGTGCHTKMSQGGGELEGVCPREKARVRVPGAVTSFLARSSCVGGFVTLPRAARTQAVENVHTDCCLNTVLLWLLSGWFVMSLPQGMTASSKLAVSLVGVSRC